MTYPKFETRGDLKECVGRFREWLQNKIIDLEVAASTPSPTIEPSVHTVLIGHSMGGIVAAETLLAVTSDKPVPSGANLSDATDAFPSMAANTEPTTESKAAETHETPTFMFPHITGILAFDTPYLGISPGVVAHGAEQHYKTATTAYTGLTELAGAFGYGGSKSHNSTRSQQQNQKMLTQGADALSASMTAGASADGSGGGAGWQKWGKYAMFAGAAGAVAAGGAAAYLKRDTITEGWSFIGSHLEFVGCLARGEELKTRLEQVVKLNKDRGVGFANLITVLGKAAPAMKKDGTTVAGGFVEIGAVEGIAPNERTFCTIPKSEKNRRFFEKAKNDKAADEMAAHMGMFTAKENSGYYPLGERSRDLIAQWINPEQSEWYKESQAKGGATKVIMDDIDMGDEPNAWASESHTG